MSIRDEIRAVFAFRPSPVRWPIALQAAVSMGIPSVGFALAGRSDLGLLASTGAFLALYLSSASRRLRIRALPLIAAGLIAAAAIGVSVSASTVLSLVALFVVVAVAATLCLGFSVGPPGAMFFPLVAGVTSHLAAPVSLGGAAINGALIVGMLSLGCLISYAVVLAPLLLPSVRARDAGLHEARTRMTFSVDDTTRIVLVRLIVASAIAVAISGPLGIHRSYWVVLTVVAILQNGHRLRLTATRVVHRVLGTLVGVGLFALIMFAEPAGIVLALLVVVLQFGVELVVIRHYGIALVLITPLALTIATQGNSSDLSSIVGYRVIDTLVGAAIATGILVVSFAWGRFGPGGGGKRDSL